MGEDDERQRYIDGLIREMGERVERNECPICGGPMPPRDETWRLVCDQCRADVQARALKRMS